MLAAMHGKIYCVQKLLEAGANVCFFIRALMVFFEFGIWTVIEKLMLGYNWNFFQILMFDSRHGRTCLHYAAYYGHSDCLHAILSAAHSTPIAVSWWDFLFPLPSLFLSFNYQSSDLYCLVWIGEQGIFKICEYKRWKGSNSVTFSCPPKEVWLCSYPPKPWRISLCFN